MKDRIEFYDRDNMIASVDSAMVPAVGQKISIRGKTWDVVAVSFALDYADKPFESAMRANVDLKAAKK